MNKKPVLIEVDDKLSKSLLNNPNLQNYMANITQQRIVKNIVQQSKIDYQLKNPNERTEQLLEEANDKYDKQIKLLEERLQHEKDSNSELQNKLDDAYLQLRQLNDKESIQTGQIKQLWADLKEESLQREIAESKLNAKDWKTAFIALVSALLVLAVEHWKDIYNFILSLIELQP